MPNEIIKDVERRVRDHFHADADRFDSIYRTKKGAVSKFIDNYWRGVVQKRLEINIQKLRPLKHKRILDVGCGSGRFCHAFAKEGAGYLLGVDFAPAMIEIATRVAKELGVDDRCEFRIGAFLKSSEKATYRLTLQRRTAFLTTLPNRFRLSQQCVK
jgi:ubiquinone/menaquinone biosynthesis C-methylase UbiE